METKLELQGFDELESVLVTLPQSTAKSVARRVMKRALVPMAEAMKSNAPRGLGDLIASIGIGTRLSRRQARMARGDRREGEVTVYVGAGALAQATQTEFGNEHMPAQPWARPAFDQTWQRVMRLLASGMSEELRKVVARRAKRAAKGR